MADSAPVDDREPLQQPQQQPHQGGPSSTAVVVDTTYFRSLDGILRMVAIACAAVGIILIIADLFSSVGGWFFFVGFWFIVYCTIVMVINTCIPKVYMHGLIDAIIIFSYAALWFLSSVLNIAFSIRFSDALLGVASILGFVCGCLSVVIGTFSLRTWKAHGEGRAGHVVIF